jgi:hypothetical protein
VITAGESTRNLAADAVAVASDVLKSGNALSPFLIIELDGLRDIEYFEVDAIQRARERASLLSRPSSRDQLCALVYEGRVGMDESAILVEVGRAGEAEVEVFTQAFRPDGGRFRRFKLIGELSLAGRREALA